MTYCHARISSPAASTHQQGRQQVQMATSPLLKHLNSRCLQAAGLALKEEPHTMRVPRSQRGGDVVEPLVQEQWFVRAQPLAKPALQVQTLPLDRPIVNFRPACCA